MTFDFISDGPSCGGPTRVSAHRRLMCPLLGLTLVASLASSSLCAQDAEEVERQLKPLISQFQSNRRNSGNRDPIRLEDCRLTLLAGKGLGAKISLTDDEHLAPTERFTQAIERAGMKHIKRLNSACQLTELQLERLQNAVRADRERVEKQVQGWLVEYGRVGETGKLLEAKAALRELNVSMVLPPDSEKRLLGKLLKSTLTDAQREKLVKYQRDAQLRQLLTGLQRVASLNNEKVEQIKPLLERSMKDTEAWQLPAEEIQRKLAAIFLNLDETELSFLTKSEIAGSKRLCHYFVKR